MDIEKVCRCCLTNDGPLTSIFEEGIVDNSNDSVAFMMKQITSVQASIEDNLPYNACISCISDIYRFYNFKIKCESTQKTLQKMVFIKRDKSEEKVIPTPTVENVIASDDEQDIKPTHLVMENFSENTTTSNVPSIAEASIELPPLEIQPKQEIIDSDTASNSGSIPDDVPLSEITSKREYDSDTLSNCSEFISEKPQGSVNINLSYKDKNGDIRYRCVICKKDLANNHELNDHLESHEKPYSCIYCENVYTDYSALCMHILEHSAAKRFKCNLCHKNYHSEPELTRHLCPAVLPESSDSATKEKKLHKCKYCGKGFTYRGNCAIHEKTHTGNSAYKCSICEKDFRTENFLKRHIQSKKCKLAE